MVAPMPIKTVSQPRIIWGRFTRFRANFPSFRNWSAYSSALSGATPECVKVCTMVSLDFFLKCGFKGFTKCDVIDVTFSEVGGVIHSDEEKGR